MVSAEAKRHVGRGLELHRQGRLGDAEGHYRLAVTSDPNHAEAWHLLGLAAHQQGRYGDAETLMSRAIELNGSDGAFFLNRGEARRMQGDLTGAIADSRRVLELHPGHPLALNNLGLVLQATGDLAGATAALTEAVRTDPSFAYGHNNLGLAFQAQGFADKAIACFQTAVDRNPAYAEAYANLGAIYAKVGQASAASAAYRQALALKPEVAAFHNGLGLAMWDQDNFAAADAEFQRACELDPTHAAAHQNLSTSVARRGDFQSAAALIAHALKLRPDMPDAHHNLAMLMLRAGDYGRGWAEYEWRWQCPDFIPMKRSFPWPRWTGQALPPGEALLVWGEQGLGDDILFASMMHDAAARAGAVVWEIDARMIPILSRSCPQIRWVPRRQPPADALNTMGIAAHCPAGSLGAILRNDARQFGRRTSFLMADPKRTAAYRARFDDGKPVIGLSWHSRNAAQGREKSIALTMFADILNASPATFVDLQYGPTAEARQAAQQATGIEVQHFDDLDTRDDIDGVAALASACDVIITVSNTTAHLGGGLGVPTWVLVPTGAGRLWYWGDQVTATPWYPSVRLFNFDGVQGPQSSVSVIAQRLRSKFPFDATLVAGPREA